VINTFNQLELQSLHTFIINEFQLIQEIYSRKGVNTLYLGSIDVSL